MTEGTRIAARFAELRAAKRAGFPDMQSFLKTLWGAVDAHAIANDWVPIAWNLCDEPVNEAILASTKNAAAHKATQVGVLGVAAAKRRLEALVAEAQAAHAPFGSDADVLKAAARFVATRSA